MTKSIREEIEKLKKDPETITDDLINLFRFWSLDILQRLHCDSKNRSRQMGCSQNTYELAIEDAVRKFKEAGK